MEVIQWKTKRLVARRLASRRLVSRRLGSRRVASRRQEVGVRRSGDFLKRWNGQRMRHSSLRPVVVD